MKIKHILCLVLLGGVLGTGMAQEKAGPLTLGDTFRALEDFSSRNTANEMELEEAQLAYRGERSFLYPRLDLSVPFSGDLTLNQNYLVEGQGISTELTRSGAYSLGLTPTLSLTQALPTSGSISARFSDNLQISDPGTFDPPGLADLIPTNERLDQSINFGLTIDQPLYFKSNAFAAALESAENKLTSAVLQASSQRNQLALQAAELFYHGQYLMYSRSLIASRRDAANIRLMSIQREHELGMHTSADLLRAGLTRDKAEMDLKEAEQALNSVIFEIQTRYGISPQRSVDSFVQEFPVPLLNESALLSNVLANHPDLSQLRLAARNAAHAVVQFEAANAPKLSISTDVFYSNRSEQDVPDHSSSLRFGLGFSMNLLDGDSSRLRREELRTSQQRLNAEVEELTRTIQYEVSKGFSELERNRRYRSYLEDAVQLAALEVELGQRDLDLGLVTQRQLRELELELEGIRLDLARNTVDDNLLRIRILSMQGVDIISEVYRLEGEKL